MLEYEIETNNAIESISNINNQFKNEISMHPKKWENFFEISSFIYKVASFNGSNKKQNKVLANRLDQFIATGNYNVVFEMLESGYELNQKQAKVLQKFLDNNLSLSSELNKFINIERGLKLGIKPSDNAIENYFIKLLTTIQMNTDFNLKFFIETDKIMSIKQNIYEGNAGYPKETIEHKFPQLTNLLRQYILNKPIFEKFFDIETKLLLRVETRTLKEKLSGRGFGDYHIEQQYKNFTNSLHSSNVEVMLKEVSFDKFMQFFTKYTTTHPEDRYNIEKRCQYILTTYYKNNVNDVVNQTKQIYKDRIIEKITTQNIVNDSYNINVNQIPDTAKQLVKEITQTYKNIIQNNKEDFDITNLFEKRVPEVLKKYLLIDKVYQTTLKNSEGKNAEQLMIESLQNIKQSFDNKWQEVNESALSSLSVTHKYTKNFK